ncbi:alpha/beta hydrolase [Fodinicurvata sp. EGI_FJ10296]|uniref:alpha/beta fold hydrolase n=1 Tax=Fodinicurvata sp. EGI_FJ10296 TaxID=3231908 RepID=UPI0034534201
MTEGRFDAWRRRAQADRVLASLAGGVDVSVALTGEVPIGRIVLADPIEWPKSGPESGPAPALTLSAPDSFWHGLMSGTAPPGGHGLGAALATGAQLKIDGRPGLLARARPALERLFELAAPVRMDDGAPWAGDAALPVGRYADLATDTGERARIYFESSGPTVDPSLPPVVFLHTAGADSRQFHFQLADGGLSRNRRLYAFDMPRHGRSLPLTDRSPFERADLDAKAYIGWCKTFMERVVGEPAILIGCSMGAMAALMTAADHPDLVAGAIAVEAPERSPDRRSADLSDPGLDQTRFVPAYVRSLMSPHSPERYRDLATWIYSQGGFSTYVNDIAFYSRAFDGSAVATRLNAAKMPVALLTGSYDYSASPASTQKLHAVLPQSRFVEMTELGHFPMIENPPVFTRYLADALAFVDDGRTDKKPDRSNP